MNADDEALDRIRSADPARAAATDLGSLRRAVDLRIDGGGETSGNDVDGDELVRDELAARRARRSRRTAWVAGAAASVIVGTGGYLAGISSVGGGGADVAGAEQADSEEVAAADGAGSAELDAGGGESAGGGSSGEDSGATVEMADEDSMAAWGRVVFVASGLSAEESSGEAFAYDASGIDPEALVAELAASLGIDGDPAEEGGLWSVRGTDGRSVEVYADGTASVSYSDPSLDPWACAVAGSDVSDPDAVSDPGDGGIDELGACPDEDSAGPTDPLGTARAFLTDLGVDLADLDLSVDDGGYGVASVNAYAPGTTSTSGPVWSLTIAADGVYSAWGWFAPTVSLGSYDVVSPVAAVDRLMDPRFGAGHGIQPYPIDEGMTVLDGDTPVSSGAGSPAAPVAPGSDIPWPVQTYTITDAELVLGTYALPDGAVVLLPTWSLTSDGGLTWSVLAITDDALDFDAAG